MIFQTADSNDRGAADDYKKTQRQLLKSRFVIMQALRDEGLSGLPVLKSLPDPVSWLESNLSVTFPDDAEIMTVSLAASQPGGLDQVVNAVIKSYFDEVVLEERKQKAARLNDLELTHTKYETKLRTKQTELKQLVERVGDGPATRLSLSQQNAVSRYAALTQELHQVQIELMQVELELKEQNPATPQDEAAQLQREFLMVSRVDPELQRLQSDKQSIQQYLKELKKVATPETLAQKSMEQDQRLKGIDTSIVVREEKLRLELKELRSRHSSELKYADEYRLRQLRAQESHLNELLAELHDDVNLPQSSTDVEMMRMDIAVLQDVVREILGEIERTKVELQPDTKGISQRVTELSKAYPAMKTDPQGKLKTTAGAAAAGFFLPFLLLIWLESRNDRIYTKEEIVGGLGLPVIGAVPFIPPRIMRRLGDRKTPKGAHWRARLSESVDSIAAVLLRGSKAASLRVVMVSSSSAGEGKTTLAANLATSLAAAGRRTVLVDFDLRRPALHRVFDLPITPGVWDVLRDSSEFDSVVQSTAIPNLSFVAAGRSSTKGLANFSGDRLKLLFSRLRAQFEFVVVDASPILPVVDTRLIAQHVDTVVLSVLTDVSRIGQVRAAMQHMEEFGVSVLGVVMIGSKRDAYPSTYYHAPEYAEVS